MQDHSSILYKADQRTTDMAGSSKHLSTFNLGQVPQNSFGNLAYLNDVFLSPGHEATYAGTDDLHQLILPVAGQLCYGHSDVRNSTLSAEEVLFLSKGRELYSIKNNYNDQTINYLHIGIKKSEPAHKSAVTSPLSLQHYDQLVPVNLDKTENHCFAGIFKGRSKGSYQLRNKQNGVFAYVINGAFEIEHRLVEYRDGLALWQVNDIEFEALSEFAILLLFETPLNSTTIH